MWICVRCETKNEEQGMYCAVCGMKRGAEVPSHSHEDNPVVPPQPSNPVDNQVTSGVGVVLPGVIEEEDIVPSQDGSSRKIIGVIAVLLALIVLGIGFFFNMKNALEIIQSGSTLQNSASVSTDPVSVKNCAVLSLVAEETIDGTAITSPIVWATIHADLPEEADNIEWKILKNGTTSNAVIRVRPDANVGSGTDYLLKKDTIVACGDNDLHLAIYQCSPNEVSWRREKYLYDGSVAGYSCRIELSYTYNNEPYVSRYTLQKNLTNHGYNAMKQSSAEKEPIPEQAASQIDTVESLQSSSSLSPNSSSTSSSSSAAKQSEVCSHKNTASKLVDTEYHRMDDTQHQAEEKYEIVCKDCGEVVDTDSESFPEDHAFNNDSRCTICGYQGVVECKHENTVKVEGVREEAPNGEWSQKVDVVCEKCGEIVDSWYRGGEIVDFWCKHESTVEIEGPREEEPNGYWCQEIKVVCDNCGVVLDSWYRGGSTVDLKPKECTHESTVEIEGPREEAPNGEWSQEVELVCEKCGEVLDSWYRGGVNVDIMIPGDNNEVEIEDNGEAAKPVS